MQKVCGTGFCKTGAIPAAQPTASIQSSEWERHRNNTTVILATCNEIKLPVDRVIAVITN